MKAKTTRSISIHTKNQVPDSNWDANRFVEVCTENSSLTPRSDADGCNFTTFTESLAISPRQLPFRGAVAWNWSSDAPISSSCSACDLPQSKHATNRRAAARGRRARRPEDGGVSWVVQAGIRRTVRISSGHVRHWSRVIQRIMVDRACSTARGLDAYEATTCALPEQVRSSKRFGGSGLFLKYFIDRLDRWPNITDELCSRAKQSIRQ